MAKTVQKKATAAAAAKTKGRTKGATSGGGGGGGEKQVQKSPAEFFAENQAIAGFDNLGKSLYTSIRELVENSLDACESIGVLPEISIRITEYTQSQFNRLVGIDGRSPRKTSHDTELFESKSNKKASNAATSDAATEVQAEDEAASNNNNNAGNKKGGRGGKRGHSSSHPDAYFQITVRDNGCGMRHDAIPDLLGRVLSGSKYGVRQTRGKFGLGAKMCLIWSKKSTGQPIRIKTSHRAPEGAGAREPRNRANPRSGDAQMTASSTATTKTPSSSSSGGKKSAKKGTNATKKKAAATTTKKRKDDDDDDDGSASDFKPSDVEEEDDSEEENDEEEDDEDHEDANDSFDGEGVLDDLEEDNANVNHHVPQHVSTCVLDIDIYKNEPKILEHERHINDENWVGTEMSIIIAGNWTTYKSRIVQYLQQLAIITPYALLELHYEKYGPEDGSVKTSAKRKSAGSRGAGVGTNTSHCLRLRYDRRSEQMPPPAKMVKHHPSSVNNLVVQSLIQYTRTQTLTKFLTKELCSVSPPIAKRLIQELKSSSGTGVGGPYNTDGDAFDEDMPPSQLSDIQITRLVQILRQVKLFKPPDGACLSPLGEYNLRLGIQKVLEPDLIATARDKPSAYEGHPFLVEAAVSIGGRDVKEGITVVRFANRIPLLFEGGADVSTRVANTKIRWSNYKIDHRKDKVGVFVSIVSTKIPFKGTSKEYIGDDATEIQQSVKRALQSCCQQLRARLAKRNALKDAKERKSRLTKYVPDIGRSLFGILDSMRKRRAEDPTISVAAAAAAAAAPIGNAPSPAKRRRLNEAEAQAMIQKLNRGEVTEESIQTSLREAIDHQLEQDDLLEAEEIAGGGGRGGRNSMGRLSRSKVAEISVPVFLVPLYNLDDDQYDVCGTLFTFRPIQPISFDVDEDVVAA